MPNAFSIYYMATGVGAGLIQMFVAYIRVNSMFSDIPPEGVDLILTEGYGLLQQGKNYSDILMGSANISLNIPTVGASGAVFGILLAFGMLFPNTELMLLFPPIPIKAKYFVIGYGAIELWMAFSNSPGDNVAHSPTLGNADRLSFSLKNGKAIAKIFIEKIENDRRYVGRHQKELDIGKYAISTDLVECRCVRFCECSLDHYKTWRNRIVCGNRRLFRACDDF